LKEEVIMNAEMFSSFAKRNYTVYEKSVRRLSENAEICVVRKGSQKSIAIVQEKPVISLNKQIDAVFGATIHELTWENYEILSKFIDITPVCCSKKASFGTGDRMGLVTAAHLSVDSKYDIFPIVAQQSPRELEKTHRSFKSVLLDAVMGALEIGYTGEFGADADHIKDETRFIEGVEAGYTMFTLDVSDELRDISKITNLLGAKMTDDARQVAGRWSGRKLEIPGVGIYEVNETEMLKSALIYEKSMQKCKKFYDIAIAKLKNVDLEVSIDEGGRDTTPEDHIFCAAYLHDREVNFKSLAPRFPGEFQKAIDYMGDMNELEKSFRIHAEIARILGGYRLSLHSGSDKFSVYPMFREATKGNFHIKTSGTSWLMAINLIAHTNPTLFKTLYELSLKYLPESKLSYHVYITPSHFQKELPEDLPAFFATNDVSQLFHISYGALLDEKRNEIYSELNANEEKHYELIMNHIEKHLKLAAK
jgi:tagaturonate epimerase